VIARAIGGREHKTNEPHRFAIQTFEIHACREAGNRANHRLEAGVFCVRDRHAAPDGCRAPFLALEEDGKHALKMLSCERTDFDKSIENVGNRFFFGAQRSVGDLKPTEAVDLLPFSAFAKPEQATAVRARSVAGRMRRLDHKRLATNRAATGRAFRSARRHKRTSSAET
jgi:hypothetical protein